MAGGLYDQHPDLLEQWIHIFQRRAEKQAQKDREEKAKQSSKGHKGSGPGYF